MVKLVNSWQPRLIQLLTVPGLLIAFYLLLYHNGTIISICTPSGWEDCGQVSGPGAPYASVGPIPVAMIGLIGYALIFLLVWLKDWLEIIDDYLPELLLATTGLAFLFSMVLTGLELFVIHAFCRYCVVSAVLITIMFMLSISYLRETGKDYAVSPGEIFDEA